MSSYANSADKINNKINILNQKKFDDIADFETAATSKLQTSLNQKYEDYMKKYEELQSIGQDGLAGIFALKSTYNNLKKLGSLFTGSNEDDLEESDKVPEINTSQAPESQDEAPESQDEAPESEALPDDLPESNLPISNDTTEPYKGVDMNRILARRAANKAASNRLLGNNDEEEAPESGSGSNLSELQQRSINFTNKLKAKYGDKLKGRDDDDDEEEIPEEEELPMRSRLLQAGGNMRETINQAVQKSKPLPENKEANEEVEKTSEDAEEEAGSDPNEQGVETNDGVVNEEYDKEAEDPEDPEAEEGADIAEGAEAGAEEGAEIAGSSLLDLIPGIGELGALVTIGDSLYHLLHHSHHNAPPPVSVTMSGNVLQQQLTSKYASALPSMDSANDHATNMF